MRQERDALRARGNRLPSGTEAVSPSMPPLLLSAPTSTPNVYVTKNPVHIDLSTLEPSSLKVHYDPCFQRTQANISVTPSTLDTLGSGPIPRSDSLFFASPHSDLGQYTHPHSEKKFEKS